MKSIYNFPSNTSYHAYELNFSEIIKRNEMKTNLCVKMMRVSVITLMLVFLGIFSAEALCINPTDGGIIAADQSGCAPSYTASTLTSAVDPSGYTGTLEYKWQQSTTSGSSGFTDIPSSNSSTYDPGTLTVTTWFQRLARVDCMPDWSGAAVSNVVTITVNPLPTPTISGSTVVCEESVGYVYTTESDMTNYIWSVSGGDSITAGGSGSDNTITIDWKGSGIWSISVNYTDLNGCTATDPYVLNIFDYPRPEPNLSGPPEVCAGSTGNVYATDGGQSNYTWFLSSGGSITSGGGSADTSVTVTWNSSGNQSVGVNYEDIYGCWALSPTSLPVTVDPEPTPTISGPTLVCNESAGNIYTTQAGNSGYTWVVTGGTITSGTGTPSIAVTWTSPGSKTVTVNYTNSFGCTAAYPDTLNVIVIPLPTPTITGPNDLCMGSTGITYTTEALMSNYNWSISAGGTITGGQGTNSVTVSWNSAGTQNISVTYHNVFGCGPASPTVYPVLVNPLPSPTITGPASACVNSTGNLYFTEGGMTNYAWVVSAGGTITAGGGTTNNTVTVTWNTAGARTVSVNYTNAFGCNIPSPTVYNVTVNPLPVPSLAGPSPVCAGSTGNVYTTDGGMSNYLWTISGGGTITAGGGTGNSTVTVTWNTAGAQTVTVNYTNGNGCTAASATSKSVTVNALPTPTIAGPASVCATTTGNVYSTQPGMTNYTWSVSAGGVITAGGGPGNNTVTVTWNGAGAQTVSVNYTNGSGCTAAAPTVYNVTVNALPAPTVIGPNSVCVPSAGNLYLTETGMTNYTWSVSAGGTITSGGGTGNSFVIVTWNTAGAQTVSINYTNAAGCTAASPTVYNVTVHALPVPTIAGPANACLTLPGNVYTTQAGMTNYLWSVSAGGTITAGGGTANSTVTVTWNTLGAQTVSVNYTNGNGCTAASPTVYNVTVNPIPTPTIAGPTPVCAGITGNIYTTQAGMSNYVWAVSAGGSITAGGGTGDNTVTVTWNTAGAQTVSVNYNNSFGCPAASPTVYNVTVNAAPVPTIAGPASVCVTSAGNVYTTQAGMTNYLWSVSAGGTITAGGGTGNSTVTVTWNTAGAQTVSVNYTNGSGCTAASPTVYPVTVNALPVPTIAGPTPVCVGIVGNVYTTQAGMTNYLWSVSAGGTITAGGGTTNSTVTITWNAVGAQTVSVNYTNGNGCTAAAPTVYNVTVNALPTPTLSGPTPVCAGTTGNVYTTESGMTSYIWSVSAGGTITGGGGGGNNTVTVTWNTAGAQTVSVNYTNAGGCTAVAPTVYNVTVNALPTPTIAGPTPVCVTSTGNVYTTQAGMTNYLWSVSAGGSITAGGGTGNSTVTVTWNTAGAQTVSINYTNSNGCTAAAPTVYPVTVNALPTPTIAGPTPVCVGSTGNVYTTQAGMTNYLWSVSAGGTITAGGGTTNSTVTVTWNTVGAQTVSVNYTNGNGCTAAAPTVYNVTVDASPTPTITGPTPVCATSTGNVYTTESGMTSYIWSVSAGGTITGGGGGGNNTVTVTWNTAGAQTVSVNYTNGGGCTAAAPTVYNVTVNALPTPTIAGPTPVCAGTTGNVYTTQAGMINYIWSVSAGGTITAGGGTGNSTVTVTWNTAGAQTVSVNYTNSNGCTAAAPTVYNVTVNALPNPTIAGPTPVCAGTTGNVYTTQAGMTNYIWSVSAGGSITAGGGNGNSTVTVTWNTPGAQTVSVNYTNGNGCTAASPTVYNVTVNASPIPTITGPASVCVTSAGNVYTSEAGMTNYIWSISAGGAITAGGGTGDNTVTITWNTAGAQTVSVNYTNGGGCTAASPTVYNVTVNPIPTPTIAGPTPVCATITGNVYTTQAGMTNYIWSVSAGGTITAGGGTGNSTVTVTWNTAGAQTVSVNYTNSNGCTAAAPTVYNVTVITFSTPTLSGPTPVCAGTTGNVYSSDAGMTNYIWAVSAGGTVTAGGTATDNTVTVTWNTAGAQTVSVNYTNAGGCTAPSPTVFNVTVNAVPAPTIVGPTPVCAGTTGNVYTTQAGMTNYIWAVSAGGTITAGGSSGDNTVTVTWNTAGAQTVSVNYTNGSCTAAAPTVYNVTVNALPTPTIAGPTPVCVGITGNVYTTQAGMTNYIWAVSAGGTITAGGGTGNNTVTVTWTAAGAQTVSVNYTNGNGCTAAAPTVYNVTVNALPTPTIAGPTPVCAGTTGNVYTTQAGMTNYIWAVSAGGTITAGGGTGNSTVTVTWNTAGAQTVSVNYTNGSGCTAVAPIVFNVTVNALPTVTIAGPTPVCAGTTGNVYTTQAGMTNYIWAVSAGGTITAGGSSGNNTVTVTWNTAGAQTVSVNYTNGNGCTAAAPTVYNVTVNALPTPTIAGPASVCVGSTGNVYTTQAGMTNYIWAVSAGGTITAGGGTGNSTVTITWTTVGAQTVSINYTNGNGCTAAAPTVYNVTVNALPTPTIAGPTPVCAGTTGNVYTTQAGMTNYIWTVSAGGTITAGGGAGNSTVTVTWNTAGAQTVSVNYTNANGCTAVAPFVLNVTVNAAPVPTLSGPTPVCGFTSGNVYTTQAGMTNYIWAVSAGGTVTAGGTATDNTVTITWNIAGAQTVSVNYTNANGCTALAPTVFNVTVSAIPTPTVTGPSSVCVNTAGNVYTTEAGMTNYIWSVSSGGTVTGGGSSSSNTVTVTWTTVGAQFVGINYTNPTGCTAPVATTYNVTVNPRPVPTITGPNPVCIGSTGNVYSTQAGMSGYTWIVSAGGTITAGGGTGNNTVTVTWNTVGAQTVSINYNNGSGCAALLPTVYNVTVNALPVPTITGPAGVCVGTTGNVYTTQAGMTNYIWAVSAGGSITAGGGTGDNFVTVTWNVAGAQTVSVNYTNAGGCSAAAPVVYNVTVSAPPVPTITGQTSMCINSGYYNYTTEAGMLNYVWTVSSGGIINYGSGTNQIQVSWIIAGPQTVSVIYTNPIGCSAVAPTVLNVTVNPDPDPAGTITGTALVCAGTNGVAYSVAPIANATTYVWALPPNATIASGTGTNSITVDFAANSTSGPIIVYGNNICGDGANSPAFDVTVNPLPAAAGTITGPNNVCVGTSGVVYSVAAIANATGYNWTVPTGVNIVSGANTNSITVDFTLTAASGNITVIGTDSCGNGTVSPNFAVTVNPIPPTPVITNSGDTLHSSAPAGNQWYFEGSLIIGANSQTYVATQSGHYWDVVDLQGCSSDTSNHLYIIITGIAPHPATAINLYPVPNNGRFNVSITTASEQTFSISVYNNLGVKIYEETKVDVNGSLQRVIDLRPAPDGVYSVIFKNSLNEVVKRIVVNK
jgi:hypothetical protein